MISILIPTYNYNITLLVEELYQQALESTVDFEIIVMDDASTTFKSENSEIVKYKNCRFIELETNIGRSKIRNKLATEAKYDYLIFLDCDAEITIKNFVINYINSCKENIVAVGGRIYEASNIDPNYSLTLAYGRKRESYSSVSNEAKHRQKTFTTPNFLISKSLFDEIKFDETIKGYGHEDTIFGVMLHQKGIEVLILNNPVVHKGLDNNVVFLKKTEEALANLLVLYNEKKYPYLEKDSKILGFFIKIKKLQLKVIFKWIFLFLKPIFILNLTSKHPSLITFDCYKLGYLCKIESEK